MRPEKINRIIRKSRRNLKAGNPFDRLFAEAVAINVKRGISRLNSTGGDGIGHLFTNGIKVDETSAETFVRVQHFIDGHMMSLSLVDYHWLMKCINLGLIKGTEKTVMGQFTKLNQKLFFEAIDRVSVTLK